MRQLGAPASVRSGKCDPIGKPRTSHRQTSSEDTEIIRGLPIDGDQWNLVSYDSAVLRDTGVIRDLPFDGDQWKVEKIELANNYIGTWSFVPKPLLMSNPVSRIRQ